MLDPLDPDSPDRVDAWLSGAIDSGGAVSGSVEIALASDDPDDLTLRQARVLGTADRVIHSDTVPEAILIRARADAERIPLATGVPISQPGLTVVLRTEPSEA